MKKIETRNNMSRSEIKKSSMRRALHDDISMMIVDLKRLKEKLDEAWKDCDLIFGWEEIRLIWIYLVW